jgi:hypothetical protein
MYIMWLGAIQPVQPCGSWGGLEDCGEQSRARKVHTWGVMMWWNVTLCPGLPDLATSAADWLVFWAYRFLSIKKGNLNPQNTAFCSRTLMRNVQQDMTNMTGLRNVTKSPSLPGGPVYPPCCKLLFVRSSAFFWWVAGCTLHGME